MAIGCSAMPNSDTLNGNDLTGGEVLTLPEIAAYLRVPEEAVSELVSKNGLPAQKIGGEWRFLKRAVAEWLHYGPSIHHEFRMIPPPWVFDHPFWEDLIRVLEKRILSRIPAVERPHAKPGSKEAVLKHFGVFEGDADVEAQLAAMRARRKAAGE